jgi:predicted DNA-binding protein (MmcQ/YjbR family)
MVAIRSMVEAVSKSPSIRKKMDIEQLKAHCAQKPGAAEILHGAPSNILVYKVGGKTFAYFKTSEPERWRFSIRVASDRFLELTDIPGVKPARYMGRHHWVTIVEVLKFPEDYLRELVQCSYDRALASLSKARRKELTGSQVAARSSSQERDALNGRFSAPEEDP